jgi:hypothetical protein
MSAALEQGGVPGQVERPSLVAVDAVADRLPAGTVPVEVTVFQFDPRWACEGAWAGLVQQALDRLHALAAMAAPAG